MHRGLSTPYLSAEFIALCNDCVAKGIHARIFIKHTGGRQDIIDTCSNQHHPQPPLPTAGSAAAVTTDAARPPLQGHLPLCSLASVHLRPQGHYRCSSRHRSITVANPDTACLTSCKTHTEDGEEALSRPSF